MSRYFSEKYKSLKAYVPGEQPRDREYIKLNTNESPYPPSPGVLKATGEDTVSSLALYPDPDANVLRNKLAEYYGVKLENVFVSNGSDDILNFAFMAFGTDKGAAFPDITYGFYKVFCRLHGIDCVEVPLAEDFTVNAEAHKANNRLNVIANPNAPTGIALPLDEIEAIVASNPDTVTVVDEAYVDFGGDSAVPLTKKYDNVIVVGTYSKSRSMAGARLGFAIANEDLIRDLGTLRYSTNPYDVNTLTQKLGAIAIDEAEYYIDNCRKIMKTREDFTCDLLDMGFSVLPSKTNFVFARHPEISGDTVYSELRARGILVRHFRDERIKDYNRITIGTEADMKTVAAALREITQK